MLEITKTYILFDKVTQEQLSVKELKQVEELLEVGQLLYFGDHLVNRDYEPLYDVVLVGKKESKYQII